MAKYIEVGQDIIEFPDTMSDAEIERVLASQQTTPAPASMAVPQQRTPTMWEEAGRQLGLTARAGITGAASLPAMLAEPLAAGINLVAGKEVFPNQAAALQQALTNMGFPEPKNTLERAVQTGASAVAGVGAQAGAAQASGKALLAPFTAGLPQQAAAAGASGMAAQATSERASEAGFSPEANLAASLAAGLLAGSLGSITAKRLTKETLTPVTMDEVKKQATQAYSRVDESGVAVKPQPLLNTVNDIEANLIKTQNFNPLLEAHRPVKVVLDQMRAMVGTERVSFSKLDQLRQAANNIARESTDAATRRLAGQVVSQLDDKITALQPTDLVSGKGALQSALKDVKEARDAWRKVSKATVLEDALNVAEARALDPKASEGELIRTQFKALAANKNKMRMFSKEEQEAIRKVVSGDSVDKMLSLLARFNPERSQLMTGLTIGAGFANPWIAGGTAATGMAADKALGAVQRKAAQDVISQILSGRIPRPQSNAAWRALVEARAQQYGNVLAPMPQEEQQ